MAALSMFMPHIAYELSLQYYSSNAPIACRSLLWNRAQQGKVAELRAELLQPATKKDKNFLGKKIALKKIVANMTMSNNDMVALFPDIIGCMAIESLEIKKMWVGQCFISLDVLERRDCRADDLTTQVLSLPRQLCADEAGSRTQSAADVAR